MQQSLNAYLSCDRSLQIVESGACARYMPNEMQNEANLECVVSIWSSTVSSCS